MGGAATVQQGPEDLPRREIPSLDGLRAVAIAIVILSHTKSLLPAGVASSGLFRYAVGGGLAGVQLFFVISGYLITTLLLREFDRTGDVSLRRFYARRTLRIFPPFYLYLSVLGVLWAMGVHGEDLGTFVSAATYTIIYHPNPQGWAVQHAWSLSIEEQFYLLWPIALVIAVRRGVAKRVAICVLAAMPLARFAVAVIGSPRAHQRLEVNLGAIDMLMVGCLLALLARETRWRRWCERWVKGWLVAGAVVVGFVLVPYVDLKLTRTPLAWMGAALGSTFIAFSIGAAIEYMVRVPRSFSGRLLNLSAVRHIGVISYSVYLWQQVFTINPRQFGVLTYALILISAEASFWLVEKPLMRWRARFRSNVMSIEMTRPIQWTA